MALSMRRASISEINAAKAADTLGFILGLDPFKPADPASLITFYDSWLEAHWAFSGQGWDAELPSGFILSGEEWHQPYDDIQPTQILRPEDVKTVAAFLNDLPTSVVNQRLDDMASGLSPFQCTMTRDELDQIATGFSALVDFMASAAAAEQAVVKDIG